MDGLIILAIVALVAIVYKQPSIAKDVVQRLRPSKKKKKGNNEK